MSLSARIVLRPSLRLAVCECLVAAGGIAVAADALVVRWPEWSLTIVVAAIGAGLLSLTLATRRTKAIVVVSDRPEVGLLEPDVAPHARNAPNESWRLADGTMVWPGFSVIALTCDGPERRTLPALDRDLDRDDRRALHRFLLWTLRGGAGRRTSGA